MKQMVSGRDKNRTSEYPGLVLAAPKSGSGKTLITCALLAVLQKRGLRVQAFKCGPDYIDPMFHREVLGVPSVNLDTWFTGREGTRELFVRHMNDSGAQIGVVEGVMGLYDGLGGITGTASTYDLAETLMTPIILIVDARGMGRSVIAEIRGFQTMDDAGLISGVILNRTSASFAELIGPEIEKECDIPVIGRMPMSRDIQVDSRHLGLKLPEEIVDLRDQMRRAADLLEQNMNVDQLLRIAEGRADPEVTPACQTASGGEVFTGGVHSAIRISGHSERLYSLSIEREQGTEQLSAVKIAVARDEAFCFYYEDNLRLLEQMGAEIVFFSPVHDSHLPEGISGIYLGGGYPELRAAELSANEFMREEIRHALQRGMPSIAECGGFMYLHEFLETENSAGADGEKGGRYPMAGIVPGICRYQGRSIRFGYCSVTEHFPAFLPEGESIRGHEFHYYDSGDNGSDCTAAKPVSGKSWECIHETDHSWWGFSHLYWLSAPEYAEHFVECCREWQTHR